MPFSVSEVFISQSAADDGDIDRIERMQVCEELWTKCRDKIQVNFATLFLDLLVNSTDV